MQRVRLAIVGCGNISQLNARGYLQHPQCDVVALCDTVRARAEARAQQWGISPRIYTDLAQVLNDAQIDAVELLTPTFLHAEQIIAALDAGKHVSCQKPLCISVAEADRIVGSRTRQLRIIPFPPKPGTMPSSQHLLEGAMPWCRRFLSLSWSSSHSFGSLSSCTSSGPSQV